jgi:hypothetical protein
MQHMNIIVYHESITYKDSKIHPPCLCLSPYLTYFLSPLSLSIKHTKLQILWILWRDQHNCEGVKCVEWSKLHEKCLLI